MIIAHGVGSRGDLPLPLWLFSWGSAIALVVSFLALGVLWTRPQLAGAAEGRVIFGGGDRERSSVIGARVLGVFTFVGRAAALGLLLTSLWAGLFGLNEVNENLLPVSLYVVVWVGAQMVNGLLGDVWRAVNPITTLARGVEALLRRLGRPPAAAPSALGLWPAVAGLLVFLFYELAHPSGSQPRTLGWLLLVHLIVSLALAARWGADWIADNEPFAALFTMLASMGIFDRRGDSIAVRAPMTGLTGLRILPGSLALLLIVLGGTTFDGFSESEAGRDLLGPTSGWGGAVTLSIGLAFSVAIVSSFFVAGVWWTSMVTGMARGTAAAAFTPSLVPIVFGYAIAHYAQLFVDEIQRFVFHLSDPGGLGWDLFGGSDGQLDFTIISVDLVAWIQVLSILFGHVGAVVVAHDRSIELFKAGESLRSQFAMLLVMVTYSTLGLWLLLNA